MTKDKPAKFTKRSLPPEVRRSVKSGQDRKAEDIVVLDLRDISTFTDFFVIVTGNSARQNRAIYESVERELKKDRLLPIGVEGRELAEWILIDYGSFVVHVFSKQARGYYLLEKLWGDAPRLSYAESRAAHVSG
jgi:ribosome-associated protein